MGLNEPGYHAWLVFLEGTAHMLDNDFAFCFRSVSLASEFLSLSFAHTRERQITRTEYS